MKGADQCPKCASRLSGEATQELTNFYARKFRVCGNCGTAWEPIDPAELLDPKREPLGAFKHPCDTCAFRKGSPEQADRDQWDSTMWQLAGGGSFYCHKGVPITPNSEHGFDYPAGGQDPRKLRLCRGYLNSIVGPKAWSTAAADDDTAGPAGACADLISGG